MSRHIALVAAAVTLSAAAAFAGETGTFRIHAKGVNPTLVSQLHADLLRAEQDIRAALDAFPDTVGVHVFPSREAFSVALHDAWGIEETACWMVGGADDHALYLLSPDAWAEGACEHDPDDVGHVRRLVMHEALHVYHGQMNPSEDLGLLEDLGWFIEGLATYLSGQLEAAHQGDGAAALEAGGPERLADAWSGRYRYGVAGSMVAFIDQAWGRPALRALLTATSQAELLAGLQVSEEQFLELWEEWVRKTV